MLKFYNCYPGCGGEDCVCCEIYNDQKATILYGTPLNDEFTQIEDNGDDDYDYLPEKTGIFYEENEISPETYFEPNDIHERF